MHFDLENPHTLYVISAYAVAAVGYVVLTLHTFLTSLAVQNRLREMDKPK